MLLTGTILSSVNGMKLDTQFTGGVILKYTCSGKADTEKLREDVEAVLDGLPISRSTEDPASGSEKLAVTLDRQQGDFDQRSSRK